ncbi:TonB-dependent receptor [Paraglaciecola aquimarina]|uniref:TonB-dependent receptor n=1 Tax=Paraglaciecola aquimarina TaxID=1235557 RepID=A0ABU3SYC8_9ALTE|nr:TonB-dependent receptor [Paraglaciecola aquimarina]MDU0355006.1 TonB-dependent receptor [Paraglaciecola aquimarina]
MKNKFRLKPIALAMMPMLLGSSANLAIAQENTDNEDEVEVIEVTGFKGSLLKSLNNKRTADSITDSIFAEDIGKSADQDIGEALQRVTGVSIQRGEGAGATEGTTVTVRGAGPNLNNITLNGVILTGNTENQAVDLSAFSSDILNSIEVFKTSSADQDEGSLGATVQLKTFRPLNSTEDRKVFEIQGRYDDYVGENDYKLSGSYSTKLLDNTLGIYITAFSETQAARRDMFFTNNLEKFTAPNAIDASTGEPINSVDSDGNIIGDPIQGYVNSQNGYKLFQNNLERDGLTASIQWLVTDDTELNFNVTMSDQYRETNDNTLSILPYLGPYYDYDIEKLTDASNPWLVYDPTSQMFIQKLDRMARGRTIGEYSGINTENRIYNLELTHNFTDNLKMDFRYGYSKTKATDDHYAYISTGNAQHVPIDLLESLPHDQLQPVGYDCRTGVCNVINGSGIVEYGPDLTTENFTNNADHPAGHPYLGFDDLAQYPHTQTGHRYTTVNGELSNEPNMDNTIYTGYNPDDIQSMTLAQGYTRDRNMYDKQQSVYLDFDWFVDFGPITFLEFGAKYQKQDKDIFNQRHFFNDVPANRPVNIETEFSVGSVRVDEVTNGVTPYGDSFLADLGYPRTNITDGWYTVDPDKALLAIFGTRDVVRATDLGNSRFISPENKAAYVKTNFTLLDDDLTGNFGLRYVKSAVESIGYSGVNFQIPNVTNRELVRIGQDSSLPACTDDQIYDEDGLVRPAGGLDANGKWSPLADQMCFHEDYDFGRDATLSQRYFDYRYPVVDKYASTATNEEENWLPSLTLNYSLNDETVIRFAASKTISRPNLDDRRPTNSYAEAVWGASISRATLKNPNLKNLQSKNIDLSYEWYFNEGGALSIALYNKEMSNIPETVTIQSHWLDLRGMTTEELSQLSFTDVLIEKPADKSLKHDELEASGIDCLENRRHRWQSIGLVESEDCDIINVQQVRNASGATNRGIEIGYNQNYDFLPGWLSGLGTAFNYTYSDSKTNAESGALGADFKAMPLANVSKHTYNLSTFWEKDGNLIRLAYNYRSDSLANRNFVNGALWNEGSGQLDISGTYKLNDHFTITFNAVNVNNRKNRQYYTNVKDSDFVIEGDALEDSVNKSRTIREWVSGTVYRLGLRGTF